MKIYIQNLGCKVNRYESDAVRQRFLEAGYEPTERPEEADVCIVNTCAVTAEAARKSRQFTRRMRRARPDAVVVAMGCQVVLEHERLSEDGPLPDLVIGQGGKHDVLSQVQKLLAERDEAIPGEETLPGADTLPKGENLPGAEAHPEEEALHEEEAGPADDAPSRSGHAVRAPYTLNPYELRTYEELGIVDQQSETRAYVKVQDGCSFHCSYCTIPAARGPSRSRPMGPILDEAEALLKAGYKELVLTGVEVASYGKEPAFRQAARARGEEPADLVTLLTHLDKLPGLLRLRLSSLEPGWFTETTMEALGQLEHLAPHFHLSLQSGCDATLRRMKRRYTTATFAKAVRLIRQTFPHAEISADVITGFPGETEDAHRESMAFCEAMELMRLHVFPFSSRPGTEAARMPQVDGETVRRRREAMQALSDRLWRRRARERVKREGIVLVETADDGGSTGYTEDYWPVRLPERYAPQTVCRVRLELPEEAAEHVILPTDVRLIGHAVTHRV